MSKAGSGLFGLQRCSAAAACAVTLCAALAACSGLPASAPTVTELEQSLNEGEGLNYALVNVDERIATILHQYRRPTFGARFKSAQYRPSNTLYPGDIIGASVFEIGGSSLFGTPSGAAPAPGQQAGSLSGATTNIPPQVIEADGTVMVPYAGRMNVAGKTPGEVGIEIQKALEGKAVEPQVVVTLISNATNTATVGGEVNAARPVPLTLRGERLLDVIAAAGGAKYPAWEVYVSVVRRGQIGTVLLQTVVNNPSENVLVRPNDQIFITRHPRTFAVLGATAKVSQYTFDTPKVTLAEAVARAGGPIDTVGNPSGIYLFRYEPGHIAQQILGKEAAVTALASATTLNHDGNTYVPILYRVDFRKAGGYFLSQDIQLQDKDVVLVTNADTTQLMKTLTVVRGFTGIAYDLSRGASN
jgi:polysaccharide export outer membrane protein